MDFINAYSSALSSENSKSDGQARKPVQQPSAPAGLPTYVPFKTQYPLYPTATSVQSYLTTYQLSHNTQNYLPAASKATSTSFTQLFDDAIYVFRKNALQAVELGIGEMIAQEKTRLTNELMESQRNLQQCYYERAELKKQNEEQQLYLLRYQEIMTKMAYNISDLKIYRTDSLYGYRVMRAWSRIARHSAKSRDYENLLEDSLALKAMRNTFMQWKYLAFKKSFLDLRGNFTQEIQKMSDYREEFFASERSKYENKIEMLKHEMAGFAIKEKKMKDAMKQAFLKGINAISEEATIAMDRSERLSMPQELRAELEGRFEADGRRIDDVALGSDEEPHAEQRRVRIAPTAPIAPKSGAQRADEPLYEPDGGENTAENLQPDHIYQINTIATAELQQTTQFDHVVQQPIYVGSPARLVATHNIMASQDDKVIGGVSQQITQTKTATTAFKTSNAKQTTQPNLAQRLKGQSGQKAHPSSMIYKESVKQVGQKIKVERE